MNITICYFARFREKLGVQQENYTLPKNSTCKEIKSMLSNRGGSWQEVFSCTQGVLVAVNQEMATLDSVVTDGDEVAFFPPVTGG
ncbi:MAG: molybdopterin converting factor subunit 1 [Moraxellaceae bacterium]|nr:molybdopterin converting factor subunit 1 [Moraxellaceae bacterium]HQV22685.1 molybdopterin converting factor subunit 1 [Agitococcus sp.]